MIIERLKRGLAWLLLTLLVLGAVAGCGIQAPAASQSQTVTAAPSQEPAPSQSQTVTAGSGQESAPSRSQIVTAGSSQESASADRQNPESGSSRQSEAAEAPESASGQESHTQEPESGSAEAAEENKGQEPDSGTPAVTEDGSYTTRDEVALYLHTFGRLPGNYITKKEAEKLGWDNKKGNLWEVAPGKSIGGSHFGNYEKLLPEKKGRKYYECDINYEGEYRGAERIIYSDDGLIFYTGDHYKTFEQLYPQAANQ